MGVKMSRIFKANTKLDTETIMNFRDYILIQKEGKNFRDLLNKEKRIIKQIKQFWIESLGDSERNKVPYWSDKKVRINARIEENLDKSLRNLNKEKCIQSFVRCLIRDNEFRREFSETIIKQRDIDLRPLWTLSKKFGEYYRELVNLFPRSVSAVIKSYEKELLYFLSFFIMGYSPSYIIRVGFIHYRKMDDCPEIGKCEVITILENLINEYKNKGDEKE